MERHWKFSYTGNKSCGVSYNEYLLKVKKKSISGYDYDNEPDGLCATELAQHYQLL
ncbi:9696_t:CDS:2, partial [Gigaspora margarita]